MHEIGLHRVSQNDIHDGLDDLMGDYQSDITYVDPPWGTGHEKFFHTALLKVDPDTTIPRPVENGFLESFFQALYKHSKNMVFVEYGERWHSEVQRNAEEAGFLPVAVIKVYYKASKKLLPYDLHIFSKIPVSLPANYVESVQGKVGGAAVSYTALAPFAVEGGILLDACCGQGEFAKTALRLKMRFFGNEFNPARLTKTVQRLR